MNIRDLPRKQISKGIGGELLARSCFIANSFASRLMGLMFVNDLGADEALLIQPCNSIHTFFMKFPIDVVYVDAGMNVVRVRRAIKPWRIDLPVLSAKAVIEFPAGSAKAIAEGDHLCIN